MADSVFDLSFNIDTRSLDRGLTRLGRGLTAAQRAANSIGSTLNRAFAVFASFTAVKSLIQTGDAYLNIQNRLRTVIDDTLTLEVTQQALLETANRTRTSFEQNVEVFQRLTAATEALNLGLGREGVLGVMETLNQAISISGATSIEASQALRQLTQGLASGALKGDELRSVLEQLPTIADILARQLGVTRGQLKDLGERGKITSQVIVDAFRSAREEIAEKFAKSIPTIGQAFTLLRNSFVKLVGDLQEGTGVFSLLAQGIKFIADNLPAFTAAIYVLATAFIGSLIPGMLRAIVATKAYAAAALAAQVATGGLAGVLSGGGLLGFLKGAAQGLLTVVGFLKNLILTKAGVLAVAGAIGFGFKKMVDAASESATEATRNLDKMNVAMMETTSLGSSITSFQRELNALERREVISESTFQRIVHVKNEIRKLTAAVKDAKIGITQLGRAEIDKLFARLRREGELLKLNNEQREIQQRLDKEIEGLSKKKALPTDPKALAELKDELTFELQALAFLERKKDLLEKINGQREEDRKELELAELLQQQGLIRLEDLHELQKQINGEPFGPEPPDPLAVGKQVDALKEQLEIQKLMVQGREEEAAVLALIRQLQTETTVSADQAAQLLLLQQQVSQMTLAAKLFEDARDPAEQYRKEVQAIVVGFQQLGVSAEQAKLAMRDAFLRSLEASVAFEAGVQRAFLKMQIEAGNFAKVGEDIVNSFANSISGALETLVETGKFSFKEFARSAIADITKIIARLLVMQALSGLFAPTPTSGSPLPVGTAPFDLLTGLASGGTARAGQPYMVGEEGPELFTPRQTGTVHPNGAPMPAPQVNVQNVTVMSPDLVPQAMASGKVDQQVVNIIGRQKDVIARMLSS